MMRMIMVLALTTSCCLILTRSVSADEPRVVELAVSPRAIEDPILKYRLLPSELELQEGDAATILLKLPWDQMPYMEQVYPTLHGWSVRPLEAPEWAAFTKESVLPDNFFNVMKRAAYRHDADWQYPIREEPLPFMLLPDLHGLRNFAGYGLTARARYHLSRGELDQAREVILVGFANGRHVAQGPFVVSQLVAASIHSLMLDQTAEMIAQPDSPNLYWALSMLPDSLLNLERAADLESNMWTSTLPALRELERPRDPAEWTRMADQLIEVLKFTEELKSSPPEETAQERIRLSGVARTILPSALNVPSERAAGMTDDEALIRWFAHARTQLDDLSSATMRLPPREAAAQFRRLTANTTRFQADSGLQISDATTRSQYVRLWSVSRKIQALRVIEAVRHSLAAHDSKFPEQLSEITDVPVPIDPLSDQPFEWTVDRAANTATLKAPPISSDFGDVAQTQLEYRLRVR